FFGFFDFWVKCGKSCFPKGYRNLNTQSGRKETVLDLAKFVDKGVQVKLTGGRQVTGTLKGYDQLLNLVLDEAVEFLRGNYLLHNLNMLIAVVLRVWLTFELYSLMNVWCLVSMKSTDLCRVDWN
ncbi:hypothetical protein Goshw_028199, partial [Gossypium schwendimanii]|nr:hypothetical protein [Gossypium schwendimanii]